MNLAFSSTISPGFFILTNFPYAGVAELVDALGSGPSVRKDVRVQVPPSAPFYHFTTPPHKIIAKKP